MFLYVYAKPDVMQGHRFSDDVAITFAWSKKHAYRKFSWLYKLEMKNIKRISIFRLFGKHGVDVLTDY